LIFGLFEYPSGIVDDLLGDPDEVAIFTLLLGVALPRCHALDLLHAAPCTACSVTKVIDSFGKTFPRRPMSRVRTRTHPRAKYYRLDDGYRFGHRRIDAQSLAVLQSQIDGGFKDQVIKGLQVFAPKLLKARLESVVLRDALAV